MIILHIEKKLDLYQLDLSYRSTVSFELQNQPHLDSADHFLHIP